MIWHILKKDWKLLWRMAAIAALLQLIVSGFMWNVGRFGENGRLFGLAMLLCPVVLLARVFLIASAVHQDPLPGLRQDWLARPIRRREILAAKLLFMILVVQGPVFAGDVMEALLDGFSLSASLEAALSRSLYLLIVFSLPVLVIASVTKNLMEVIMGGMAGAASLAVISGLGLVHEGAPRLVDTGLGWTVSAPSLLMILVCSTIILAIQYQLRKTVRSRWLIGCTTAVLLFLQYLPWQSAAFAMQGHLSPAPGAAQSVDIEFAQDVADTGPQTDYTRYGMTSLYVPLRVSGLPNDSILADDYHEVRLVDSHGMVRAKLREGSNTFGDERILVGKQGSGGIVSLSTRSPAVYQEFSIDTNEYAKLKDERLHAEIDLSLTLMGLSESYAIPAVDGDARLPGVGWCGTRINGLGTRVELRCLQAGGAPDCVSWFLEHRQSGRRNTEGYACDSRSYSPYFARFLPDALARPLGSASPLFHDVTGRTKYPVDSNDIGGSQVVIRNFRPLDHFTRKVTTPETRLSDWLVKSDAR